MYKFILVIVMLLTVSACAFDPISYDQDRKNEHQDHLKQNGY